MLTEVAWGDCSCGICEVPRLNAPFPLRVIAPTQLDCLVNNAGCNVRASMHEATEDQYETILRTNMDGTYFMCKLAHPLLTKGTKPCIINVASVAGVGSTGTGAIYAMSKAAIIQLTKSLACVPPRPLNIPGDRHIHPHFLSVAPTAS